MMKQILPPFVAFTAVIKSDDPKEFKNFTQSHNLLYKKVFKRFILLYIIINLQ